MILILTLVLDTSIQYQNQINRKKRMTLATEIDHMTQDYNLRPIIDTLETGGLILYPTDTIWGVGCDATDPIAVEKVFALKNRPRHKPFILLVSSIEMLRNYVEHLHPRIETLLIYHNRPLTIIYEKAKNLPSNAIADTGSVGIRLVQDPFCNQLIENFGKPLVGTSANISDEPFPNHFGEVSSAIIQGVDYVVKHRQGEKEMGQPSVIARLNDPVKGELEFLRS